MTGAAHRQQTTILVVEDDAELREMLTAILHSAGHRCVVAGDGVDGLRLAGTGGFTAAIIDAGLPGLGGLELVARLRRAGVTLPVLVLSAYVNTDDAKAVGLAGAGAFLGKPFEIDDLLAVVSRLVAPRVPG